MELSLRQITRTRATAYLGVAWYNGAGRLLNTSQLGDTNFAFVGDNDNLSYFNLGRAVAVPAWTTYRKSFGWGEAPAIPRDAKFLKVGVLFNPTNTAAATFQLTNMRVWQKMPGLDGDSMLDGAFLDNTPKLIAIPNLHMLFAPVSQAAELSRHWPDQQLAIDLAGGPEFQAAAASVGSVPLNNDDIPLKLRLTVVRGAIH
ncbi:MAG: hypothetical protein JW384_03833 [Nitrosomonadaceae bacterium]|nr:hypothetical protein [Nitrosomonadaceae bacterium]